MTQFVQLANAFHAGHYFTPAVILYLIAAAVCKISHKWMWMVYIALAIAAGVIA